MPKIIFFLIILVSCAQAKDDGISFRINNSTEPESLDPHLIQGIPENRINIALFEGLVSSDPKTSHAVPGIAKSWSISEDGQTYIFELRHTTWNDGTEITAQSFVDSWIRMLKEPGAPYSWLTASLIKNGTLFLEGKVPQEELGVVALDKYRLQLTTEGVVPYVIDSLAHYAFTVVPLHAINEWKEEWTHPEHIVSNGPYRLEEWKVNEYIKVVKDPMYWDAENVTVDTIYFYPIEDEALATNMFNNGELDWQPYLSLDQLDSLRVRDEFQVSPKLGTYFIVFNNQKEPFNNPLVRKAFSLSIDKERLVNYVTRAGEIPASGVVPPIDGYKHPLVESFNPEKAKQLLQKSGYTPESLPVLEFIYFTSGAQKKIGEFLQQQWSKNLGVKVELANQEWATYLNTVGQKDFLLLRGGWSGDYLDPSTFLDLFITGNSQNSPDFKNESYNALMKEVSQKLNKEERYELFSQADQLLVDEAALAPMYYYSAIQLIDTEKWTGWYANIQDLHTYKNLVTKQQ